MPEFHESMCMCHDCKMDRLHCADLDAEYEDARANGYSDPIEMARAKREGDTSEE